MKPFSCLVALAIPTLFALGCGDETAVKDMAAAIDMNVKDGSAAACTMIATWPTDDLEAYGDPITDADSAPFTFRTIATAYRMIGDQLDDLDIEVWHQPTTAANPRTITISATGDYANCETCVVLYEDLDDNSNPATSYFARGGTVTVTKADIDPKMGAISVTASDLHLVEWDSDANAAVAKGKCYDIGKVAITANYDNTNPDM